MIYVGIFITIFNMVSVYYAAKNNIYTWVYGFFASFLTIFLLCSDKMYFSMIFNAYSAIMCVIGLFKWYRNPTDNDATLSMTSPFANLLLLVIITILLIKCSQYFGFEFPFYDSLGTSASIIGTYLLLKKDVSCWYFWIIVDSIYISYGINTSNNEYIIIYGTMLILAIHGLVRNKKLYLKQYNERKNAIN